MSKSVRFGSISIREYDVVVGDNPSCSCGPPVGLDWNFQLVSELEVDEYERCRPRRRSQPELTLSPSTRWIMLLDRHSPQELDAVVREISRLQRMRNTAIQDSPQEWMDRCDVEKKPSKQPNLKNFFTLIVKGKSTFKMFRRRRTSSENSTASTLSMEADDLFDDSLDDTRDISSQVDDFDAAERDDPCEEDEPFTVSTIEI